MHKIFILLSFLVLTSCISNIENRGFMFELTDANLIEQDITSKERVLEIMGSPTIISNFDEDLWIYYFEKKRSVLFFNPKVIERKILTINFNNDNYVNFIKEFNLNDENKKFSFDKNYTKVESRKENIFKELFGNVGQISAQ